MTDSGIIGIILITANLIVSYKGFTSQIFFDRYKFEVDRILFNKDYKRLVTSGFLHTGWVHLIFNMISLYAFSGSIESSLGIVPFLIIYFASLIGGNLFALFVHRHHGDYSSVGSSGAISGIIFAAITIFPGMGIGFFGIPFSIPAWLYGVLYVLFSIYGIRSRKNNIGHEAHLGGALIGMTTGLLFVPSALSENYLAILIIAVPTIAFIYFIATRPYILFVDNLYFKQHKNYYSVDHKYNDERNNKQKEIDRILDKINKKGMGSLNEKEKEKLKEYSQTIR